MQLRLHFPSLSDVPDQSSLRLQRRLQRVIVQSCERAVTILGLSDVRIEIVRDETMEIGRSGVDAVVGDQLRPDRFPEVAVLQNGDAIFYAGGSPYIEARNLARAFRWGAALFGRSGYIVLQPKGALVADQFYVVRLVRRTDPGSGVGVNASILPLQDYVTVAVVDRKGRAYFRKRVNDPWTFAQVERTLAKVPVEQSTIDLSAVRFIVMMDRAIFAEIPWEKRAEYLELLLQAWTGEREEHAMLEIIHSTRCRAELEAIFALLRERGRYEQLFADLDERVYQLLQFLAEFVIGEPIDWRYLVALLSAINVLPDLPLLVQPDAGQGLQWAAHALHVWLQSACDGVGLRCSRTDEMVESVEMLAAFLWVVEQARQGNAEAQMCVTQMMMLGGAGCVQALVGLDYAGVLGTPYDRRERAMSVGERLRGQLRGVLVYDLLTWFTSVDEFRTVLQGGEGLVERVTGLMDVIKSRQVQATRTGASPVPTNFYTSPVPTNFYTSPVPTNFYTSAVPTDSSMGGMSVGMVEGLQALLGCPGWDQAKVRDLIEGIPAANLQEFLQTMTFVSPFHLEMWESGMLKELGLHPAVLAFVREGGSDLMTVAFRRMGNSWERFDAWLEKLAVKRVRIGDPGDYQWFLQRMRMGEAAAFAEVTEEVQGPYDT